jgi:hypothetical protein
MTIDTTNTRTYHPLFQARARVLADIEQRLGRRLSHKEIMARFEVNDNVAYQTRDRKWEAAQEAAGMPGIPSTVR